MSLKESLNLTKEKVASIVERALLEVENLVEDLQVNYKEIRVN
jgi:hypothetical protein